MKTELLVHSFKLVISEKIINTEVLSIKWTKIIKSFQELKTLTTLLNLLKLNKTCKYKVFISVMKCPLIMGL